MREFCVFKWVCPQELPRGGKMGEKTKVLQHHMMAEGAGSEWRCWEGRAGVGGGVQVCFRCQDQRWDQRIIAAKMFAVPFSIENPGKATTELLRSEKTSEISESSTARTTPNPRTPLLSPPGAADPTRSE